MSIANVIKTRDSTIINLENMEIVVGTYENHLLGYKIVSDPFNKNLMLETSFTDDSHRGALRCVAISPSGILASSSTDDSIRMHSLKKRKEIGGLFEHCGTVNSIVFFGNNHMFSASEDGTISLWKTKNWEMMKTLKGHKSHVMAVTVHPSGKLGLSVGSDRSFITWDLLTGKLAFQRKLQDVAQNIFFTPSGNHYLLVFNRKIEVCSLEDTKVIKEIPTNWRINTVCHIKENIYAIGGDDRLVIIVDVLTGSQLMSLDAAKSADDTFQSRVRCLCVVDINADKYLVLASASGDIKVFLLNLASKAARAVFFDKTKVRITAMGVFDSSGIMNSTDVEQPLIQTVKKLASKTTDFDLDHASASDSGDEKVEENSVSVKTKKRKKDEPVSKQPSKKKKNFKESHDPKLKKVSKDELLPKTKKKLKAKQKRKMK